MPWVILAVVFGIIVFIFDWIDRHPPAGLVLALGITGLIAWRLWVWFKKSDFYTDYEVKQRRIEWARSAELQTQMIEANKLAAQTLLQPEQFKENLLQEYYSLASPPLEENFLFQIVDVFVELYKPNTQQQAYGYLLACRNGLLNFTKKVGPFCCVQPPSTSLLSRQINLRDIVLKKDGETLDFLPGYFEAYRALAEPFIKKENELAFLNWGSTHPAAFLREPEYGDEAQIRENEKRWEKAYAEANKYFPYSLALAHTPLYMLSNSLLPSGSIKVSFDIPDDLRTRHQWIVGAPGAGKTTFISAMIADDLKKVARNEATIFVMDSQNELIPDIANLEMFAPERPLHNKLIYLEPDPDYPLALNIFDTNLSRSKSLSSKERAMIESGAIWMVEFFLSSLVKSDASPHQDTFLNYVIPALMAIPDATIFTFKDLLEGAKVKSGPTGYDRYKQHFGSLRQDTQDWLRDRMHSPELATTRNAIRTRLDGFTARGFFHDMFMHPRNKLDLFEEMQTGKVILVNTMKGLLKNGTEPFGRYFIARLLQAAEERMFLSPGARLPVYVYLDEASDYIAEEENIEELINKARKQNVALIIANQMESQITSPIVRDALSRVAIQCRGEAGDVDEPPKWQIALGNREPVQIQVPNVNFANMPKMSKTNFEHMLADMRRRFSSAAVGNGHTEPPHQRDRPQGTNTSQWDVEWTAELSPKLAETGGIKTIHGFAIRIKPNTRNGTRVRLSGKGAKRPDGSFADAYITFTVQTRPDQPMLGTSGYYADERSETDAKPW